MYRDEAGSRAADQYRDQMNKRYSYPDHFDDGGFYGRGVRSRDDSEHRDSDHGYGRRSMHGRDYSRTGEGSRPRYDQDYEGRNDPDRRTYGPSEHDRREHLADVGRGGYGRSDFNRAYNRADDYDRTPGYDRDRDPSPREQGTYGPAGNYSRGGYGRNEFEYDADYGRGYGASMHGRRGAWEGDMDRLGDDIDTYRAETRFGGSGPHAGVGPQGYVRGKDRIREDVCERLTHHGNIDASGISVSVDDDEVTLEGTVDSRRTKRMAEDVAESVMGVRDVHNRLRIRRDDAEGSDAAPRSKGRSKGGNQGDDK